MPSGKTTLKPRRRIVPAAWFAAAVSAGILFTGIGKASPPSDASVTEEAQATLARLTTTDGPGAVVLIARGEQAIYRAARGLANIEVSAALSTEGAFRIASVTKMFTAALVLKLAEEHKLSLDDPLSRYVSDFPNAQTITIRELLNHTAGVSDNGRDLPPGLSLREVSTATLVAEIRKRPPDFPPGTRWSYSNAGFILLGAVIEKVTGEPWHQACQTQLFEPMGLKKTRYGAASPLISGRVSGYTLDGKIQAVVNAAYISSSFPAAAGGLISTADDLLHWMHALSHGQVISTDGFKQMITPTSKLPGSHPGYDYGLGMYLWQVRGTAMIGHTGQIDGFASALVHLPAQDITVIVLANDDNFDARTAARSLAAIALGQPYAEGTAVTLSPGEMQALAGTYRIDDHTLRTLLIKNGKLYTQRGTRNAIQLQMTTDQHLHLIPDEISYFVPVRDSAGRITGLDYFENGDGPAQPEPRVQ